MRGVLFVFFLFVAFSAQAQVSINPGLSGSWYNPETPGQGILLDVIPGRNQVVIGWFTFDSDAQLELGEPEHRWFTAEGGFAGNRAQLTVFNSAGGRFNSPIPVSTTPAGTATLEFASCTRATLSYNLTGGGTGTINLTRLSPDVFCASLAANVALPSYFRVTGDASGEDEDGNTAVCHFDLLYETYEVSRLPGLIEYMGIGGGEVSRAVQDETGAGFAFFADFFIQDVEARVTRGTQLELDGPGRDVDDSRLYLNLARFKGTLDDAGFGEGDWTCGPFDIEVGGYEDTRQTVRGTWHIEPIINPETALSN